MLKALIIMAALGTTGVVADKCGDVNLGGSDSTAVTESSK